MKSYIIVAALSVLTGGLSAQTSIEVGPVAEAGGEVG